MYTSLQARWTSSHVTWVSKMADTARKAFETANRVQAVNSADEIFKYDAEEQMKILSERPWQRDPSFFKDIKISALALLKMVMHARSGGRLEIMGLLLGKIDGNTMVVMDSFALPVEGTETRVNAQAAAYEYMTEYIEAAKRVGHMENAIGWYHSHPGYGCWLSGIDVSTQMLNQQYQEPWVAIVVDPIQTMSAGKVNIGAFRTYPENYRPTDDGPHEYQSIPLDKIEDFGVHCRRYYSLNISYFKSSLDSRLLDLLWNKYWVNTLSSSPLHTNAEYTSQQIGDLAQKLDKVSPMMAAGGGLRGGMVGFGRVGGASKDKGKLSKAAKDSSKIAVEAIQGLIGQVIKSQVFMQAPAPSPAHTLPQEPMNTE